VEFPKLTTQVIEAAELGLNYGLPALLLVALLGTALLGTSNLSWYIPGFGWIPRRAAQSRVLHLLSIMLQTGKPIPQSLELVANMPVGRLLQRKILRAQSDVERGQPFAESLCGAGLLPGTMTALVQAAERAGNLPWALGEMALTLHDRLVRAIQRLIEAFFPIAVLAVAALVAFIVTGMYIPIVKLIEQLVEITG
jgi:type II secretory pathway component PulF